MAENGACIKGKARYCTVTILNFMKNSMDLMSLLAQAQGGQAVNNLASQMNLAPEQAQSGIAALLPALTAGMQRNTESKDGMSGLMNALSGTRHEAYVDDAAALQTPEAKAEGNAILGHLFGSKDVSRNVAQQAAESTGLDITTLKSMLPMVANMAMGAMSKQTSALSGQSSGLMGMVGSLLGGGQQNQTSKLLSGLIGGATGGNSGGGMNMLNMALGMLKK